MKSLGGTDVDLKPERRAAPAYAQKPGQPVSPDTILVEARDLADGDKITNLLIDETAAMRRDGEQDSPRPIRTPSNPPPPTSIRVVFNGGQLAEAGIAGDGASDLDLFVYDENDHLVCRSTASTDREYCRWWPRWTGPFRIEVQNLGDCRGSVSPRDQLTKVSGRRQRLISWLRAPGERSRSSLLRGAAGSSRW